MSSRVYIGRLGRDVREKDVENFFKGYGKVIDISLKEGFGFINFEEHRDAEDAVYDLNGKELCGERVIIEHARSPGSKRREMRGGGFRGQRGGYRDYGRDSYGRDNSYGRDRGGYSGGGGYREFRPRNPPQRTDNRILIENLSSRVSWQDLKDLMKKVGEVTFADAHKIRPGDGVVEFASSSDVKRAIDKFDGYEFEGRKMKVKDGRKPNQKRSRSYSRSQSRSRSSSRSRGRNDDSNSRHKNSSRDDRDHSSNKDSKPRSYGRHDKNSDDEIKEKERPTRDGRSPSPHAERRESHSHSDSDDHHN